MQIGNHFVLNRNYGKYIAFGIWKLVIRMYRSVFYKKFGIKIQKCANAEKTRCGRCTVMKRNLFVIVQRIWMRFSNNSDF